MVENTCMASSMSHTKMAATTNITPAATLSMKVTFMIDHGSTRVRDSRTRRGPAIVLD
jgi:hypothetical protein